MIKNDWRANEDGLPRKHLGREAWNSPGIDEAMQTRMIATMPIAVGSRCCLYQLAQIHKVKMKLVDDTLYTLSTINAVIYCRYGPAKKLVEFKLGWRRRMRPRGPKAGGMRNDGRHEIL